MGQRRERGRGGKKRGGGQREQLLWNLNISTFFNPIKKNV
jgi:hypothetical protein